MPQHPRLDRGGAAPRVRHRQSPDPEGKEVRIKADHYYARVLQHEIDHLNGVLFTDRVVNIKSLKRISPDTDEEEVQPSRGMI